MSQNGSACHTLKTPSPTTLPTVTTITITAIPKTTTIAAAPNKKKNNVDDEHFHFLVAKKEENHKMIQISVADT